VTSNASARQGLTGQIRNAIGARIKELTVPQTVHCVVVNFTTGPPSSLSVKPQGTSTIITGIRYPSWYTPVVGHTIVCHRVGTDLYMNSHFQP